MGGVKSNIFFAKEQTMKVTARMFGVLCAVGMVFCAACDNMENGGDGKTDDDVGAAVYEVGTIVTFEEKQYLVTKNTEVAGMSAKYGTVIVDGNTYYPHEKAATYHAGLLQKKGVTEYVELYDLATAKDESTGKLDDRYTILQKGVKFYTIRHQWNAAWMFANLSADEQIARFKVVPDDMLRREWDPGTITFQNERAVYGDDLVKKTFEMYIFGYNDKEVSYADNNLMRISENKAYKAVGDVIKAIYEIERTFGRYYSDGKGKTVIKLKEPVTGNFFWLTISDDGSYQLRTQGDGKIGGSKSSGVYDNKITINSLYYDAKGEPYLDYSVSVKGSSVTDEEKNQLVNREQYLHISPDVTTFGKIDVPCEITFAALYKDADAPLGKYTQVTFVPKQMFDMVVYEPKTDATYGYDFIKRYADDYQSLYAGASAAQ